VSSATVLTEDDKKKLAEAKTADELKELAAEVTASKVDVKFKNANPERGYPLTDLVWNESRANLSVRIYIEGEALLPENKFGIDKVASFKYNTFTIIRDGIVNVKKLPVLSTPELHNLLVTNGVGFKMDGEVAVIDLTSLPLVNRGMVKAISAEALAKQQWELKKLQGEKKVYDYYRKELFPKTSESFKELLGEEAAAWLKEVGITDYNGFSPKVVSAEAQDFYMSVVLDTKIKGLSGLPKVVDVWKKIESGADLKLNEFVMADALKKYHAQMESDMYQSLNEEQQKGVLKTYLETKSKLLNVKRRKILQEIAQIKFSLILSKKWFTEFQSFDENQLALNIDGQDLNFTFALAEKEEKI
jgi:ribosome maturation factor RimP